MKSMMLPLPNHGIATAATGSSDDVSDQMGFGPFGEDFLGMHYGIAGGAVVLDVERAAAQAGDGAAGADEGDFRFAHVEAPKLSSSAGRSQ